MFMTKKSIKMALEAKLASFEAETERKMSKLSKENADLIAKNEELSMKIASLEASYGPLFDFFLREKEREGAEPKKPRSFGPEHEIRPDGDYEEGERE